MLIRIQDGLIVDHTLIRSIKKDTHSGGTKPILEINYTDPVAQSAHTVKLFDQAEIDRVYSAVSSQAR